MSRIYIETENGDPCGFVERKLRDLYRVEVSEAIAECLFSAPAIARFIAAFEPRDPNAARVRYNALSRLIDGVGRGAKRAVVDTRPLRV